MTPCFLLTPTDQVLESLRRYVFSADTQCPNGPCHDTEVVLGHRTRQVNDSCSDNHPHDDPRWPTDCACGYLFTDSDCWQHRVITLYRRSDNNALVTLRDAPVGAMWYADWLSNLDTYKGPDDRTVIVRLPGNHDWTIDSRASNCDSPCQHCGVPYKDHKANCGDTLAYDANKQHYEDSVPKHKCWVRHGTPPQLHVDKSGLTCNAGAGSIMVPGYHGFLHNGCLTDC